jgi:hypothetical protein
MGHDERVLRRAKSTREVAVHDEEEIQQGDEAADVSAAGQAASAGDDATLADPDPDLIEAAAAAEKPDEE